MIAKTQIARQQLQIDEDDYRQAVFDASGQMSLRAVLIPSFTTFFTG
jgi:hypothetical protein